MYISELTKTFNTNQEKINKKKASIARLEKQLEKMQEKHSWIKNIIKPIAQEISSLLELPMWEILGPFGLSNETSIHFAKDEDTYSDASSRKSITFLPKWDKNDEFTLSVKNYTINTGTFQKDSIGEINGMNHPSVDITNLTVKQLAKEWVA